MSAPGDDFPFLRQGGRGYDEARTRAIWNKRLDRARAPDAIVCCSSTQQAAAAVRHARANGLKVSPRGSGHHYEAAALRQGGLLLDLGDLKRVDIDPEARTAWIGAGVCGGELSERLAEHGFAFPVGHCVDVGLSGYILAGGFGWNGGEWGAASANVEAIEAVTAEGEIVIASEQDNADLFWAARGHGPGLFATVTAYRIRLHPLPPAVWAWRAMFPLASAPRLVDWINAAALTADRSLELGCFVLAAPDSQMPAIIVRVSASGEDEDDARARTASFASPPTDVERLWAPKGEALTFTELPRLSPMPSGKRVAADHVWSEAPVGDLLLAVHHLLPPSPDSTIDLVAYGGSAPVALPENAALSITGRTGAGIYALWDDAADDDTNRAWVRRVDEALAPYRTGRYVGEADLTLAPDRRAQCFAPGVLDRIAEVRQRYDPHGVFFAYP